MENNIILSKKEFIEKVVDNTANVTGNKLSDIRNISIMGNLLHTSGDMYEQSVYDSLLINRESYPITAETYDSLYKLSAQNGLESIYATPARINTIIIVKADEIIKKGLYDSNKRAYVLNLSTIELPKDNDLTFRCPYPVELVAKDISVVGSTAPNLVVSVSYDKTSYDAIGEKYIVSDVIKVIKQGTDTYMFELPTFEYIKTGTDDKFLNTDTSLDKVIPVSYTNQFADISIAIKTFNAVGYNVLAKKSIYDLSDNGSLDTFFYHISNETKLNILFKYDVYTPNVSDTADIKVYTTNGDAGNNIELDAKAKYNILTESKQSIVLEVISKESSGGSDRLSITDLRAEVIDNIQRRDSILSTHDLAKHYNDNTNTHYVLSKLNHTNIAMDYSISGALKTAETVIPSFTSNLYVKDTDWDIVNGDDHMLMDLPLIVPYTGAALTSYTDEPDKLFNITPNAEPDWTKRDYPYVYYKSRVTNMTLPYFLYYNNANRTAVLYNNAPNYVKYLIPDYTYEGSTEPLIINSVHVHRDIKEQLVHFDFKVTEAYTGTIGDVTSLIKVVDAKGIVASSIGNYTNLKRFDTNLQVLPPQIIEFATSINTYGGITVSGKLLDINNQVDRVIVETFDNRDLPVCRSIGEMDTAMSTHNPVEIHDYISLHGDAFSIDLSTSATGLYFTRMSIYSGGVKEEFMVDFPYGTRIGDKAPEVTALMFMRDTSIISTGSLAVSVTIEDPEHSVESVRAEILAKTDGALLEVSDMVATVNGTRLNYDVTFSTQIPGYYYMRLRIKNNSGKDIDYITSAPVYIGDLSIFPAGSNNYGASTGTNESGIPTGTHAGKGTTVVITNPPAQVFKDIKNESRSLVDTNRVKLFMQLGTGYLPLVLEEYEVNKYYTFRGTLDISEAKIKFDLNDKLLHQLHLDMEKAHVTTPSVINVDSDTIRVFTYSKEDEPAGIPAINHNDTNIPGTMYHLSSIYSAHEFSLFKSYYDDIKIQGIPTEVTGVAGTIGNIFTNVPVIDYNFYNNNLWRSQIVASILAETERVNDLYLLTEQNYDIGYRLSNTKAFSKYTFTGSVLAPIPISLNIRFEFNVKLSPVATIDTIDLTIFTVTFFNSINFIDGDTFHISKLFQAMKDTYSDLLEIELVSMNGLNVAYQRIFMSFDNVDDVNERPSIGAFINENGDMEYDIIINKI